MSETLFGVVIGGIIGVTIPLITVVIDWKKWKAENRISHLRLKKESLERNILETRNKLTKSLVEKKYPIDMAADFEFIFPTNVYNAFCDLIHEKDQTPEKLRSHNLIINRLMKSAIAEIDRSIEKELGIKHTK